MRAEFCRLSFVITQNSNTYEKQTDNIQQQVISTWIQNHTEHSRDYIIFHTLI